MSNSGSSSDVESSSLTGWQQSSPAQSAAATKLPPIFGILNGANWCLSPSPGSSQDYAHNLSWFSYVFLANLGPMGLGVSTRPGQGIIYHLPSTIHATFEHISRRQFAERRRQRVSAADCEDADTILCWTMQTGGYTWSNNRVIKIYW